MPRRTGQVQSALGVERAEPDRARDLLEPRLPPRILVQFGFLRPWAEVPALMGSAPPAAPPSTGTGVVTFLMG
jgi:hypothetical protein